MSYSMNGNASKRLAIGTVIYMIGNLMSKILQMLILPVVTKSLLTSEYGYYDLIITTINLVTPIVTFQMIEGMFRFMFNNSEEDKMKTVSTVTAFLAVGCLALGVIVYTGSILSDCVQYPGLIYLNYVSSIIFSYMQKLARCQQKNRQFAISGVLNTVVMLGIQTITLVIFKMGIDGMLLASCVSYFLSSVYLLLFLRISKWIKMRYIDKNVFIKLFKYSAPLIPNSICWWLVSSSDRYIITFFIDAAANGIYSIAGKFAQLLIFVTSVFQLAWQESAIIEENSEVRDEFYTNTFNIYMKLLMGGYLVVLPFIRLLMPILLDESYQSGYIYNPVLLAGAIFSAFSQFYGTAYLVFKKTEGAFYTTIYAAIINIVVGVGLIKYIGLFAPALGTTISFMVQWVLRAHQMKDYFKVKIDKRAFVMILTLMIVITMIYYINSILVQIISFFAGMILFLIVNREFVSIILKKIFNR